MANRNSLFRFEILILSLLSKKDFYGYDLTSTIKKITDNKIIIKDGTLYPLLYKLLDRKYISQYDKQIGKKIRVYYHIEETGLKALEEMIREFDLMVNSIYDVIHYEGDDIYG